MASLVVNTFLQAFLEVLHHSFQRVGRNCCHFFPDVLFQIHHCPWFLFVHLALEISSEEEVPRLGTLVPMNIEVPTKIPWVKTESSFLKYVSTAKDQCSTDQRSMATQMLWVLLEERSRTNCPHQSFHSQLFCKIIRYFCQTLCNIRYKCPVWLILNCSLVTNKSCYKFSYFNAVTDQMLVLFWVTASYSGYVFPCFCYDWPNSVKPSYVTDTFVYPYHISFHFNKFGESERCRHYILPQHGNI